MDTQDQSNTALSNVLENDLRLPPASRFSQDLENNGWDFIGLLTMREEHITTTFANSTLQGCARVLIKFKTSCIDELKKTSSDPQNDYD